MLSHLSVFNILPLINSLASLTLDNRSSSEGSFSRNDRVRPTVHISRANNH